MKLMTDITDKFLKTLPEQIHLYIISNEIDKDYSLCKNNDKEFNILEIIDGDWDDEYRKMLFSAYPLEKIAKKYLDLDKLTLKNTIFLIRNDDEYLGLKDVDNIDDFWDSYYEGGGLDEMYAIIINKKKSILVKTPYYSTNATCPDRYGWDNPDDFEVVLECNN